MIVDTSFLVALFIPEDELHEKALNEIENNNIELIIPDRVIEETFTVMCYKKGLDYALDILEKLKINKDVIIRTINEEEFELIINLAKKLKKKLSFVDYVVIYLALNDRYKILCFDDQIIKIFKNLN